MRGAPILQRFLRAIAGLMRSLASALDGAAGGRPVVVVDPALAALSERFPGAPDHWLRMISERAPELDEAQMAPPEALGAEPDEARDDDPRPTSRRPRPPLKLAWWRRNKPPRRARWRIDTPVSEAVRPVWSEAQEPADPHDWPPTPDRERDRPAPFAVAHDRRARPELRLVSSPETARSPLSLPDPPPPRPMPASRQADAPASGASEHPAMATAPPHEPRKVLPWPGPARRAALPEPETWAPLHDAEPAQRLDDAAAAPRRGAEPWVTVSAEPSAPAGLALGDAHGGPAPSTPWAEPPAGRTRAARPETPALDPRWPRLPPSDAETLVEAPAVEVARHVREQELGAWSG